MRNMYKWLPAILLIAAMVTSQSCQKEDGLITNDNPSPVLKSMEMNTFYGPTVPVGNGVARAWVEVDKDGNPDAVGVNFTEKALQRLPDEPASYVLPFPKMKGGGFYKHVFFDWNPHGHEPEHVYDVPHFDFHFYIISSKDRMAIPAKDVSWMDPAPDAMYIPPGYLETPGLVPEMGAHWIDLLSPEISGEGSFTHTFIWGSYSGEFIFWEPMITMDYFMNLKGMPDAEFPVRQPEAYQKDGWYAMNYKISYSSSPNQFTVALTNLMHYMPGED